MGRYIYHFCCQLYGQLFSYVVNWLLFWCNILESFAVVTLWQEVEFHTGDCVSTVMWLRPSDLRYIQVNAGVYVK